jgi:hypothetical protein
VQAKPGHVCVRRTFIEVVDAAIIEPGKIIQVIGLERIPGQIGKAIIRGAKSIPAPIIAR